MIKAWLVRPKPHYIYRMREFMDNGIVAIGWPELGSLTGKTKDDIKADLIPNFPDHTADQIGAAASTVFRFANDIHVDDIAVVPDENNVYFFKITGDYYYEPSKSSKTEGYPHQRKAELLKGPVRREDLSEALQKSLKIPKGFAEITHNINDILNQINDNPDTPPTDQTDSEYAIFNYPVRLDKTATIKIPKDITQDEANRLGDFVRTLYFS